MNIILFTKAENNHNSVTLSGRRAKHIIEIIKPNIGDSLSVGELNGLTGTGIVTDISDANICLSVALSQDPPPAMPITLVVSLPRPQMLKRSLQTVACMGVKQLYLIQSGKVEKSFWQTPSLKPSAVEEHLLLGLEQARDTQLPTVNCVNNWRAFINDHVPDLLQNRPGVMTHPGLGEHYRQLSTEGNYTLFIGPEGGWLKDEVGQLIEAGCEAYHLGPRILKVETAVTALLSHFL